MYLAGAGWAALKFFRPSYVVIVVTSVALLMQCGLSVSVLPIAPLEPGVLGPVGIVALLVSFLGWIIGRFSARYLEGESGQGRYAIALLATLAAVNAVIVSADLGLLIACWVLSSVGLHHLLTFYSDRAPAVVAAHKKFLSARLAEVCLVAGAALIYREWGTLSMASIADHARSLEVPSAGITAAAFLLALGAILKSAQLPLHGWLIQVMEAPTPVSALLHAGIVNLGGFVMIRLAPLISHVPAAQALLVLVGSLTAVLAGLVMMTRISIKVRLAWSTCSQMGFMLMECGLGLYDLALLHLVAHSLYKAYAFLTAGEAVTATRQRALRALDTGDLPGSVARRVLALPAAVALVLGSAFAWHQLFRTAPVPPVALLVIAVGLATLFWESGQNPVQLTVRNALAVLALTQLYLTWHLVAGTLVGRLSAGTISGPLSIWVGLCFIVLYTLQGIISGAPSSGLVRVLYPWVYGGFYLDESVTRFTFRIWPANLRHQDPDLTSSFNAVAAKGEHT
ncbi:MAG: NADH-quinone oxidoreductase subunit L [Proteobacteria bacterium]|nr:NADH-quinone oxidoreductase subunit L [Pseudomonadota bacterium]